MVAAIILLHKGHVPVAAAPVICTAALQLLAEPQPSQPASHHKNSPSVLSHKYNALLEVKTELFVKKQAPLSSRLQNGNVCWCHNSFFSLCVVN